MTVSDAELVEALRFIWERMKLVVEPTGALAAAGVIKRAGELRAKRVGIILSGGNADLKAVAQLFA
jgi:threonine dehydratase